MEILVGSKYLAVNISSAVDVTGQEHLVIVAKSTWRIPEPGQRPRPLSPQPIQMADVFVGNPSESALLYGSDLARYKPKCDVLFNASAHAPGGEPITELVVAWQVGPLRKGMRVHGQRYWRKRLGMISVSAADTFIRMPLHMGMAFGGTRQYKKGWGDRARQLTQAHPANPVGIGWFGARADDEIEGTPAPCLEGIDDPVRKPNGKQTPISFSALPRNNPLRRQYGGTYDQKWQDDIFPFLPEDFDERFHQCAPLDQQMPFPRGGERIVLRNMVAGRPDVRFTLPALNNLPIRILRSDYSDEAPSVHADTLYFETDESRFSVVWRASTPIRRRIQEFQTLAIGPVSADIWRDKAFQAKACDGCGMDLAERREGSE